MLRVAWAGVTVAVNFWFRPELGALVDRQPHQVRAQLRVGKQSTHFMPCT